MSVAEMSATLQNKIAESIEQAITKNGRLQLSVRNQEAFLDYASQSSIRKDTDSASSKHESIMSRGALAKLQADLLAYNRETQIVNLTDTMINSLNLEDFVGFILEYTGANKELSASKLRSDPNFTYTAPIKLPKTVTRLIVGTNTQGDSSRDVLILKNIPHGTIVELFVQYIASKATVSGKDKDALVKELKSLFNAGHLTGVFTGRLIRSFGVKNKQQFTVAGGDTEVGKIVKAAVDLATTADLLSSNIYDDPELFLRTDKRLYENAAELRLTTEVQFARGVGGEKGNQDVGQLLATAGRYLSNAIKAINANVSQTGRSKAAGTAVQKLFQELKKIEGYIESRIQTLRKNPKLDPKLQKTLQIALQSQKTFNELISSRGSDSLLEHYTNMIMQQLDPKRKVNKSTTTAKATRKLKKANAPKVKNKLNKLKTDISSLTVNITRTQKPAQDVLDLTSLQVLLNNRLVDQVKQNMGSGNRRDVLNLRSGRFAESVRVERLSESRAGMITAFYTYMKNPYATFSAGGRQQYPRSRDPKLLIAKSIREIAAEQVANRLRAVLV